MKTTLSLLSAFFSALLIWAIFSSCMKSKPTSGKPTLYSLSALIGKATNLTLLDTSLMRTGLDSFFNKAGSYTFFVSPDQAWVTAGLTDSLVNNIPDSTLSNMILYSVINGSTLSAQLPQGPNASQTTLSGDSVFITNNSGGVFVNGINVVVSDVLATNGIIDDLNQPLIPPAGTLIQLIEADSSFSYFSTAITRTGAGQTNVNGILTSGNIYTVFLPTNDAFRMAGYQTVDSINNADPDSLANILTYHILPGRVFTSDFTIDSTHNTLLAADSVNFIVFGGVAFSVHGKGNLVSIPIGRSNIMAHNGVLHTIGQLLLP